MVRNAGLTMEHLIAALDSAVKSKRELATAALVSEGAAAVEPLTDALRHASARVRQHAAEALGVIGEARAVPALIGGLTDKSMAVRYNAAKALGKIGDARAVEPLLEVLKVSGGEVRASVVEALGSIKDIRALRPLLLALRDQRDYVRQDAAHALERLQSGAPLPVLVLSDPLFTTNERAALLETLRVLRAQSPNLRLNYRLPDARAFCVQMSRDPDTTIQRNAHALLQYYDLGRAGSRSDGPDAAHLLRAGEETQADSAGELLRASESDSASPTLTRRGWLARWLPRWPR